MHLKQYHTQHAPVGAFASFTTGLPGGRGGFGQSLAGPANHNVYAGFRKDPGNASPQAWQLLPFYLHPAVTASAAFTGESGNVNGRGPSPLPFESIDRTLGWASDTWRHGGFSFGILTPFERTADPAELERQAARNAFAPVVHAEIAFDNSCGIEAVELIFGLGHAEQPMRPLEDECDDLQGFALGQSFGFAALPGDVSARVQVLDLFFDCDRVDHRGLHLLGVEAALVFRVPAGEMRRFPIALGFYQAGTVTTGLRARYYYTKLFSGLADVLRHGLASHSRAVEIAGLRDRELASAPLNEHQRWLIAQATHSYFGSSQLLLHRGRPLWVMNEGEYRMINTFDLTVDHLFFELAWHPWAVANTLDLFVQRYRYADRIHRPGDAGNARGGVSFTHDMGVMNHFTPKGRSCYECDHLNGCFSHMTMEQLLNWICCAVTYAEKTGDHVWLRGHQELLLACAESLRRRDDPDINRRTGLLKWDSNRCGGDGGEITTYDSLDISLGQARNNLYIAIKAYAAWALLERAFSSLDLPEDCAKARASCDLAEKAISGKFEAETGLFPAVFEAGNCSRILPAVEGLVFPLYLGHANELRERHPDLFSKLSQHMTHALQKGICIDEHSGAWKISSTSTNTWFSKIAIAQHVVQALFPESLSDDARNADAVHAGMLQQEVVGRHAMVDQIDSNTGKDLGSRYYPRGVTAYLWVAP